MPTQPAASQVSWRIESGESPWDTPGTCVALYTVAAPRPLTVSARSGSSHSKCVIRRRSKRIGRPGGGGLRLLLRVLGLLRPRRSERQLGERPLAPAEVPLQHLLHDGRGDGPPAPARVLDDRRD